MPDDVIREDSGNLHPEGFQPAGLPPAGQVTRTMRRISWSAVWAGVFVALGMEILFTLFGLFIGFRMYNWRAANPWGGGAAWSMVWFLITTAWSMFFGAWCAARLSGNPLPGDAIMHGITTWGLATTASAMFGALVSWAVVRESISMLLNAAMAAEQAGPSAGAVPPGMASPGMVAQATAQALSSYAFRITAAVLIGFGAAVLGGWLGRSRPVMVTPEGVVPMPTRRVA